MSDYYYANSICFNIRLLSSIAVVLFSIKQYMQGGIYHIHLLYEAELIMIKKQNKGN